MAPGVCPRKAVTFPLWHVVVAYGTLPQGRCSSWPGPDWLLLSSTGLSHPTKLLGRYSSAGSRSWTFESWDGGSHFVITRLKVIG
jgi:hypothetical protein